MVSRFETFSQFQGVLITGFDFRHVSFTGPKLFQNLNRSPYSSFVEQLKTSKSSCLMWCFPIGKQLQRANKPMPLFRLLTAQSLFRLFQASESTACISCQKKAMSISVTPSFSNSENILPIAKQITRKSPSTLTQNNPQNTKSSNANLLLTLLILVSVNNKFPPLYH